MLAVGRTGSICDYLDETLEPRLHPQDPIERARHRAWIEFASGTLNDIWVSTRHVTRKLVDDKLLALSARFRRMEEALGEGPFFAGPRFSLIDAAFGPVFRYFDVFDTFLNTGVFAGLAKVTAWRRRLAERRSVRSAVSPDYPARLRAFVIAQRSYMAGLMAEAA